MRKYTISAMFLISNKASLFVYRDMKYHTRSCNGRGTVIINIRQTFKFAVANSASIVHFNKRYENPAWLSGCNRTDSQLSSDTNNILVHYGTIISWSCHNEPWLCCYRNWQDRSHCAHYGIASFQRACSIGLSGFILPKDKYSTLITVSIDCRNYTFSHFADSGSRSTSEIWKVAHWFWALKRNRWTHICYIWHIQRNVNWRNFQFKKFQKI